eukprot:CAMPEP_0175559578 /NCGR_PEP_ID=MMETSP0096-20121207/36473_1 /TAXON_ID=311494 /ORGANISM="Alexandrium monilatum, Strain CCMP3105" /LENGTH=198 /DNA_ID=CAMNT_0016862783 /DNA_START=342 /DNA_END=938 /DNA_ORIENTATION=-
MASTTSGTLSSISSVASLASRMLLSHILSKTGLAADRTARCTAADDLGVGELSLPPDAGVQVPRRGLPLPVDSDVHGTANTAAKENEWPVITHRHRDVVGERRVKGEGHVAVDVLHRQARLHHPQLHAQVVAIGVDVATGANLDRAIAGQLTRYLAEAGSLGSGFRQHGKREPNGEARPARIASVLHGDLEAGRLVNV